MGISANINIEYLIPGVFVKCIYDNLSYIGMILEKSEQDHDVRVKFMIERNDVYTCPCIDDICWIPVQDILMKLNVPNIINNC